MSSRWISIPFASPLSRSQPLINLGSSKLVARTWGSCRPVGSLKLVRPTANACRNIYSSNYLSICYLCIFKFIYATVCGFPCLSISLCANVYACNVYLYMHVYIFSAWKVYIYVYVRANICAYTYARIYVCIYADAYIAFTMLTRVCNVYAHKNINKYMYIYM
jgi:hypothetical protein